MSYKQHFKGTSLSFPFCRYLSQNQFIVIIEAQMVSQVTLLEYVVESMLEQTIRLGCISEWVNQPVNHRMNERVTNKKQLFTQWIHKKN